MSTGMSSLTHQSPTCSLQFLIVARRRSWKKRTRRHVWRLRQEHRKRRQVGALGFLWALLILVTVEDGSSERRQVIKNKILAVGRMSRVFALLRLITLDLQVLCADGRQGGIRASLRAQKYRGVERIGCRGACIGSGGDQGDPSRLRRRVRDQDTVSSYSRVSRRKSDIENERLPPDIIDVSVLVSFPHSLTI